MTTKRGLTLARVLEPESQAEARMSARNVVIRTAECCGVLVLVVALLPLIAIAGWLARGLAVAAAVVMLAALVLLSVFKAAFRERVGRALGLTAPPRPTR